MSTQNKYKEKKVEKKETRSVRKKRQDGKESFWQLAIGVLNGSVLTRSKVVRMFPFVLFLAFLTICYIANTYHAEKTVIETARIKNELKELTSEFISTKSEYMFKSKQSEVAKVVQVNGLYEATVPPKKIVVSRNELD